MDRRGPFLVDPPVMLVGRVADSVTSYLRDQIMSGQLRAGDRLRVEHLAAELQTSITPVRESLLELLGEGFVAREPRRGYVVAELTRDDIADLFDVLGMLSGELAARAATRMGSRDLAALERLQADLEAAGSAGALEQMEEVNHEFHRTVNELAHAPKIAWFVQRASRYAPRRTWKLIKGWPDAAAHDHRSILGAFHSADADAARVEMLEHIRHSSALLIGHLDAQRFWATAVDEPDGGR